MGRKDRPGPTRYSLDGYVVDVRVTPEIVAGRPVGYAELHTVSHPSPEGYMRWCGTAPDYEGAAKLADHLAAKREYPYQRIVTITPEGRTWKSV